MSPTSSADRFTYPTPTPDPTPTPTPTPRATPTPTPTPATDAAVLKKLKKACFSATFVVKPQDARVQGRPARGRQGDLHADGGAEEGKKTAAAELSTATATVHQRQTMKVTMKLGSKGWVALRHNPKGEAGS